MTEYKGIATFQKNWNAVDDIQNRPARKEVYGGKDTTLAVEFFIPKEGGGIDDAIMIDPADNPVNQLF